MMSEPAEVLDAHRPRRVTCGDEWIWECAADECPWIDTRIAEGLDEHHAHVATVVRAWMRERLDGARDDVAEAVGAFTAKPTRWTDQQTRELLATHDRAIADAALDVVRGALGLSEGAR